MLHANVARPYAQALFLLAKNEGSEDKWLDILQSLEEILTNKQFASLLSNPEIEPEKLTATIEAILKNSAKQKVNNFLGVLAEHKRLSIVPEIHAIFKALVLEDKGRADAIIESAYEIDDKEKTEFEKILSKKFGKSISVQVNVNPALIAGVKITVNDKVIDSSVKGRLNNLAAFLAK